MNALERWQIAREELLEDPVHAAREAIDAAEAVAGELRRLRAEARPEPIGYVVARPSETGGGPVILHSRTFATRQQVDDSLQPGWRVVALVPVDTTP